MKKVKFDTFSNDIPEDVLLKIFYTSPVKSLIRFSCVSKSWFNLTYNDHQEFNKLHFAESQKKPILIFTFQDKYHMKRLYNLEKEEHGNIHKLVPFQKKEILDKYMFGCANGLTLYWNLASAHQLYEWHYFSLEICNPSRLEKLTIVSRLKSRVGQAIFGFRFGYNPLNNEYKVVGTIKYKGKYEYYILTLGSTGPWRRIQNPWPKDRPIENFQSTGRSKVPHTSCNGTLFYEIIKDNCSTLVSLDLHGEKFQIIELPSDTGIREMFQYGFSGWYPLEYKGCLCYSIMLKNSRHEGEVALHILKDTAKQDWVKEVIKFYLPRELDNPAPRFSTRIMNFSNQVILYWKSNNKENIPVILFYNVHSKEFKEVKIPGEGYENLYHHSVTSHVENFLSLETLVVMTDKENTREEAVEAYKKNLDLILQLFIGIPESNPAIISFLGGF